MSGKAGRTGGVRVVLHPGDEGAEPCLALARAALERDRRVFLVQFLRGTPPDAVTEARNRWGDRLEVRTMGSESRVDPDDPDPVDVKWAEDGLALAGNALRKGGWDLVILTDILAAVELGLLDVDRVLDLMDHLPAGVELTLTGPRVHPEIAAAADAVATHQGPPEQTTVNKEAGARQG